MRNAKRIIALLLALVLLTATGCSGKNNGEVTKLSFQAASGYDYLKTLDGKKVTINGYMATSSPVDGSFIFLMNLPYQSCPFCVPNTSQLSNTMEIYPKKGQTFGYTNQAVRVVGTLVVAEDPNKPFTDKYGYEFNYKIVDAEYTIIQSSELSKEMALWQKIAQTDVVSEIYRMYDYVNFLCAWPTYSVPNRTDKDGNKIPGYYLHPGDVWQYLTLEDTQFSYGYEEGYFDGIVKKIQAVDKEAFKDLVANVRNAEALAQKALKELEDENYTFELQYLEKFGVEDYVFTLTNGKALETEMNTVYGEFASWLGSWEL